MDKEYKNISCTAETPINDVENRSVHVIEVEICIEINDVLGDEKAGSDKQIAGKAQKVSGWDYLYILFLTSVFVFVVCSVLVGFYGFVKPLTIIYGICSVVMGASLSLLFGHVFGADYKRGAHRKGGYPYFGL